MSKVKVKRHGVSMDMTAMCDVAFLLLTFFILTAKSRPVEAVQVTTPTSVAQEKLTSQDIITVLVSADGKVYMGVDNHPVRLGMLDQMGKRYNVSFTDKEKEAFRLSENFGAPMANMKQLLDMEPADRNKPGVQPGIPCDSARNELFYWVFHARQYYTNQGAKYKVLIKADQNAPYKTVKQVIATMQEQDVNNFNLITGQETKPTAL
ncbi:ExbD/TolR family protein [Siphonobacter aquaeclarae]|jgi:biopolymer transport protein ExbD|uniref:Outer membrane transport energization protein ExbD n=1 Tax=Siphonobacter aquaeclarae TaxID=563176 RepID=A0A1G9Q991_9BACT|nr:biopolymer transporter ExbD [Siphonobacter aquaeclarae]MBO9636784.1 biopolymer transporter ExbD [Siphonobacter aquaeclarae]SDM07652.1 outer membrane transport energization protein ExbD [Siphonobacter aquaeclarae]